MGKESNARNILIKVVVACLVVALSFGIIFIGEYTIDSDSETDNQNFTPGTYSAEGPGMNGNVKVTAAFDEDSITSVSVDVSGETQGIGADIGDEMVQQFLLAQSASVDGVSGATITSEALKDAMRSCIAQATGDEEIPESAGTEEADDTEETAESETAAETEVAAETEAASETEDAVEPEASGVSAEAVYVPGAYTATVDGAHGDISVTVTFTENAIVAISSDLSAESEDIGAVIGPDISKQILDAQSTDVDGVSGATITSDAFKAGVDECIAEAKTGEE